MAKTIFTVEGDVILDGKSLPAQARAMGEKAGRQMADKMSSSLNKGFAKKARALSRSFDRAFSGGKESLKGLDGAIKRFAAQKDIHLWAAKAAFAIRKRFRPAVEAMVRDVQSGSKRVSNVFRRDIPKAIRESGSAARAIGKLIRVQVEDGATAFRIRLSSSIDEANKRLRSFGAQLISTAKNSSGYARIIDVFQNRLPRALRDSASAGRLLGRAISQDVDKVLLKTRRTVLRTGEILRAQISNRVEEASVRMHQFGRSVSTAVRSTKSFQSAARTFQELASAGRLVGKAISQDVDRALLTTRRTVLKTGEVFRSNFTRPIQRALRTVGDGFREAVDIADRFGDGIVRNVTRARTEVSNAATRMRSSLKGLAKGFADSAVTSIRAADSYYRISARANKVVTSLKGMTSGAGRFAKAAGRAALEATGWHDSNVILAKHLELTNRAAVRAAQRGGFRIVKAFQDADVQTSRWRATLNQLSSKTLKPVSDRIQLGANRLKLFGAVVQSTIRATKPFQAVGKTFDRVSKRVEYFGNRVTVISAKTRNQFAKMTGTVEGVVSAMASKVAASVEQMASKIPAPVRKMADQIGGAVRKSFGGLDDRIKAFEKRGVAHWAAVSASAMDQWSKRATKNFDMFKRDLKVVGGVLGKEVMKFPPLKGLAENAKKLNGFRKDVILVGRTMRNSLGRLPGLRVISKGLAQLRATSSKTGKSAGLLGRSFRGVGNAFKGVTSAIGKMNSGLKNLNGRWKNLSHGVKIVLLVAGLIAAAGPEIAALGSAAASGLTIAAGAALAAGVGIGVAAAAFKGMTGDLEELPEAVRPAAKAFQALGDDLGRLQDRIQIGVMHNMAPEFDKIGVAIGKLAPSFDVMAESVNRVLKQFVSMITSTKAVENMKALIEGSAPAFESLGSAALNLGGAIGNIFVAAMPYVQEFSAYLDGLFTRFNEWTGSIEGQDALGKWLEHGKEVFSALGGLISDTSSMLAGLVTDATVDGLVDFINTLGETMAPIGDFLAAVGDFSLLNLAAEAIKSIFVALQPLNGSLAEIGKTFNDTVLNALEGLTPAIGTLLGAIGPAFQAVFEAAAPVIDILVDSIGQLADILAPVLEALGPALASVIGALTPVIGAVMDIVLQLAGALAPFIAELLPPLAELFGAVAEALTPLLDAIMPLVDAFIQLLPPIMSILEPLIQLVAAIIPPLVEILVALIQTAIMPTVQAFQSLGPVLEIVGGIIGFLVPIISSIIEVLAGVITFLVNVFTGNWSGAWEQIKSVFSTVWNWIKNLAGKVWDGIVSVFETSLSWITSTWNSVWTAVKNFITPIWNSIKSFVKTAITAVKTAVSNGVNAITGPWKAGWNAVKSAASTIWNNIVSAAGNFKGKVVTKFNEVVAFVKGIPGKIVGFFTNMSGRLVSSGAALIDGFLSGIKSAWGRVTGWVSGGLSKLRGLFPFSPAKWGPFSGRGYVTYSGKAIGEDFARSTRDSIERSLPTITKSLQGVTGAFSSVTMRTPDIAGGSLGGLAGAGASGASLSPFRPATEAAGGDSGQAPRAGVVIEAGAIVVQGATDPRRVAYEVADIIAERIGS